MTRFVRALRRLLLLLLLAAAFSADAARLALVIGNADYLDAPLRNPMRDARAVAAKLGDLGFAVTKVENLKRDDIAGTVEGFAAAIRPGDDVVVYYAGHGVQVKGTNYLLAVDARIRRETDVPLHGLNLNDLLDLLDQAKAGVKVVLLDACRNNPHARTFRGGSRGLARITNAPTGTLIHYATRPGQVAADGDGANGLYTTQLLKAMDTPGLVVELLFKQVASEVKRVSNGEQEPWLEGHLDGSFYFNPGGGRARGTTLPPAPAPSGSAVADFADLEQAQQQTVDARRKWEAWQRAMQAAFDKAATLTATPAIEVKAWGRFLAAHGEDNPNSTDDERLRGEAGRRMAAAQTKLASAAAAPPVKPGAVFRDCAECPEMVVIPASRFEMGAEGNTEDEQPVRRVDMRSFALGMHEITRREFRSFVRDTGRQMPGCPDLHGKKWKEDGIKNWESPGFHQGDEHPVVCVSWDDAQAYAQWLSRKSGLTFRLPSEAEWEFAARAGTRGTWHWGNEEREACSYANALDMTGMRKFNLLSLDLGFHCDDGYAETAPVGSYRANGFGLKDMAGNASEWVEDCHHKSYEGAPTSGSAWTSKGDCSLRVIRGGSWFDFPNMVRSSTRDANPFSLRDYRIGFRVARALP